MNIQDPRSRIQDFEHPLMRIQDLVNPEFGIRDGKNLIQDPGSTINIPDPQHCILVQIFLVFPDQDTPGTITFWPSRSGIRSSLMPKH
jgi:hypothetical protein